MGLRGQPGSCLQNPSTLLAGAALVRLSLWETWPLLVYLWLQLSPRSFKSYPFYVKYHGGPSMPVPARSFYPGLPSYLLCLLILPGLALLVHQCPAFDACFFP